MVQVYSRLSSSRKNKKAKGCGKRLSPETAMRLYVWLNSMNVGAGEPERKFLAPRTLPAVASCANQPGGCVEDVRASDFLDVTGEPEAGEPKILSPGNKQDEVTSSSSTGTEAGAASNGEDETQIEKFKMPEDLKPIEAPRKAVEAADNAGSYDEQGVEAEDNGLQKPGPNATPAEKWHYAWETHLTDAEKKEIGISLDERDPRAKAEKAKKAYRILLLRLHPDKGGKGKEEDFTLMNEGYKGLYHEKTESSAPQIFVENKEEANALSDLGFEDMQIGSPMPSLESVTSKFHFRFQPLEQRIANIQHNIAMQERVLLSQNRLPKITTLQKALADNIAMLERFLSQKNLPKITTLQKDLAEAIETKEREGGELQKAYGMISELLKPPTS